MRQIFTFGQACRLANLSVWEFQQLLGQHHIERHYNETDKAIGYRSDRSRVLATVTVICNATPLINFAAIARLDILQATFDQIVISQAVYLEVEYS